MKKIAGMIFAMAALCFSGSLFVVPAAAQTLTAPAYDAPTPLAPSPTVTHASKTVKHASHHKRKHSKKRKHSHSASKSAGHMRIRTAQVDLAELGYDPGPTDGLMGRKTKAAIKEFQRDHHLVADGKLSFGTYDALVMEISSKNPERNPEAPPLPPPDFFANHPDYYGYYGADYASPNSFGSPQTIPSRFGNLQLTQQQTGQTYQYILMLNGQSVFQADNQPEPVNLSRTFTLADADAIVLTSYAAGDSVCPYQHYLLTINSQDKQLRQIANCTKAYEAFTEQGNLFISFPGEKLNGWSSGAMWRYENGTLEKI